MLQEYHTIALIRTKIGGHLFDKWVEKHLDLLRILIFINSFMTVVHITQKPSLLICRENHG